MQAGGINIVPAPQQSTEKKQRYIIKSKTLGNSGSEIPDDSLRRKVEEQNRNRQQQQQEKNSSDQHAEKIKEKILERAGEMRHLKFEVIDEAAIVQVSVINSEDGTIVRKVPSDEMVEFVRTFRRKIKSSSSKLDIKA